MRVRKVIGWTNRLIETYGKPKKPVEAEPLRKLYESKEYLQLVDSIRHMFGLNFPLKVTFVEVIEENKHAVAGIRRPVPLPSQYEEWLKEHHGFLVMRKTALEYEFAHLVSVIAHELSHYVLDISNHPLRLNEGAVDLTAMLLGFRKFFIEPTDREFYVSPEDGDYLSGNEMRLAAGYMTIRQ